jgi:hypothetical protein
MAEDPVWSEVHNTASFFTSVVQGGTVWLIIIQE